jgi:hypothetical protein
VRFAYADPPYLGCCKLYDHHHPDGLCWDDLVTHARLIRRLQREFDGYALSATSTTVAQLMTFQSDARVAAWVKPFAVFKPNVNPAYTWEPVIFAGSRKRDRSELTVKDHLIESITLQKGLTGAKPRRFAFWIFDLLGAEPTDEFVDLFPGTGIIGECWRDFCGREKPIQEGMLA